MRQRYTYRAYPSMGQQRRAARAFGCARVVFNDYLVASKAAYEAGVKVSSAELGRQVTTLAKRTPERAWLAQVSSVVLQQSVRDAQAAFAAFYASVTGKRKGRKVGYPRLKSKHHHRQSIQLTRRGFSGLHQTTHGVGFVYLAGIGRVRFALSRPLPSEPTSVRLIRHADGTFELSFVVETAPAPSAPAHDRVAGIDVGVKDLAAIVYSDGTREKITNPRHLARRQRVLARRQRALARKVTGSANRAKARVQVARAHAGVRHARTDFLHQLTTRLIRENQAIAVEMLSITGLARAGGPTAQGRRAWADHRQGWQVRSHHPKVLHLPDRRRPQAAERAGLAVPEVPGRSGP